MRYIAGCVRAQYTHILVCIVLISMHYLWCEHKIFVLYVRFMFAYKLCYFIALLTKLVVCQHSGVLQNVCVAQLSDDDCDFCFPYGQRVEHNWLEGPINVSL